jgi:cytochrome c oxidase subunit 2
MNGTKRAKTWRALIASSHPLFAEGLRSLLQKRGQADVEVVGLVSSIDDALVALKTLHPDLVIVDHDDERVNRDEFLARFVEGEGSLRVVLLSLKEGGNEAIVYDRRNLAAAQIEDWLESRREDEAELNRNSIVPDIPVSDGGNQKRRGNMRHYIIAGLLVIGLTIAGIFILTPAHLLPVEASQQSVFVDGLFGLEFKIIAFLFALIVGLMIYSVIVFRRKSGDKSDGPHVEGNTKLEVAWTIVPLVIVLYVSYISVGVLGNVVRPDPQALNVNVIGAQWSWRFEYPDYNVTSTELVLPLNKQVDFHISSQDVIHSFWVPEFRVKQDALPGGPQFVRDLRVTPDAIGQYKVRCAELCGLNHAKMLADVRVVSADDFTAWVQSQLSTVSSNPVQRGEQWAKQFGCTACHSTNGTVVVGPSWKGIYGSEVTLSDGSKVKVDQAYLEESIRNPGAQIVAGFQNIMPPTIAAGMTDQQIQDVIAYIESLK